MSDLRAVTRADLLVSLAEILDRTGDVWAWQGSAGAPDRWAADDGPGDLDVWHASPAAAGELIRELTRRHAGAVVARADDPRRLRHTSIAVVTDAGLAVIDLTHGDLRVGPVRLLGAAEVTVDAARHRLTSAAAAADLLVRPVLRGRLPDARRLGEARAAWAEAEPGRRARMAAGLSRQLGARVAAELIATADGAAPDPGLPARARRRLALRSVTPAALPATWAQRRTVLPAGPTAGPLGLRIRGAAVALVGTDGSGKSTVSEALQERLRLCGIGTSTAYFGMARGNLPGVTLARRLLGVGAIGPAPTPAPPARPDHPGLDHPGLRRMAAWFYAGEYGWRYLSLIAPVLARRHVAVADRWVYDLRESPWPGSAASRVAETLIPAPDVVVLPDAPAEVIHHRKPERGLAEQAAQQERFRRLLAERPARHASLTVDTSGPARADLDPVVAAIVEAMHAPRRPRWSAALRVRSDSPRRAG